MAPRKRNNQQPSFVSRSALRALADQYHLTPDRQQGQHFVIDEQVIDDMVRAAEISQDDTVLEIGPGFGTLTVALAGRARDVCAVELDDRFAPALDKLAAVYPSLDILYGDVFNRWTDIAKRLTDRKYKLVSNLPYNITSLVLRRFTEQLPRPSTATLLIQQEVAERVVARPGQMSILSVAVQFYAQPKLVRVVDRTSFWPEPAVQSAILHLGGIGSDLHGYHSELGEVSVRRFFQIIKLGFSSRRKQLHNNLAAGLQRPSAQIQQMLTSIDIDPRIRAQDLSIKEWIRVVKSSASDHL